MFKPIYEGIVTFLLSQSVLHSIMGDSLKYGSSVFSVLIRAFIARTKVTGHLMLVGSESKETKRLIAQLSLLSDLVHDKSIEFLFPDLIPRYHKVIRNVLRRRWETRTPLSLDFSTPSIKILF